MTPIIFGSFPQIFQDIFITEAYTLGCSAFQKYFEYLKTAWRKFVKCYQKFVQKVLGGLVVIGNVLKQNKIYILKLALSRNFQDLNLLNLSGTVQFGTNLVTLFSTDIYDVNTEVK